MGEKSRVPILKIKNREVIPVKRYGNPQYVKLNWALCNCWTEWAQSLPANSGAAAHWAKCIRPEVNTSRRALRVLEPECS